MAKVAELPIVKSEVMIPLPELLPIEDIQTPEWMKLREKIARAKGDTDKTGFLLETLRKEGKYDFVVAYGVLRSLPAEVGEEHIDDVLSNSEGFLQNRVGFLRIGGGKALAKFGASYPDRVIPILERSVGHDSLDVRKTSLETLGDILVANPEKQEQIEKILTEAMPLGVHEKSSIEEAYSKFGKAHPELVVQKAFDMVDDEDSLHIGLVALGAVGEASSERLDEIISVLTGIVEDAEVFQGSRRHSAQSLSKIAIAHPDKTAKITGTLSQVGSDDEDKHRYVVMGSLGEIGANDPKMLDRIMPVLTKTARDPQYDYFGIAALGTIGQAQPQTLDEIMPIMSDAANSEKRGLHFWTATALDKISQANAERDDEIIPLLQNIQKKDISHTTDANAALSRIRTKDFDKDAFIQRLISYRETSYATPELEAIDQAMNDMASVSQKLREKNAELVGLVVFGSMEKGYMMESSDFDFTWIVKLRHGGGDIPDEIKEELGLQDDFMKIDAGKVVNVDTLMQGSTDNADKLFNGVFFGDRQELRRIQSKFLGNITPDEWDAVREIMIDHDTHTKLQRFNLTEDEEREVLDIRTTLYTPPDLKTMKNELSNAA